MHVRMDSAHLFRSGCICKAYKYTAIECLVDSGVDPSSDKIHLQAISYSDEAWNDLNKIIMMGHHDGAHLLHVIKT